MGEIVTLLAAQEQRGLDPNIVRPGWLALGIVVLLCVAVFFLAKSFARHTKKASQPWEGEPAERVEEDADRRD